MTYKTLIVDDDHMFIFIAQKMLASAGIDSNPLSFINGQKAYDYITQNTDSCDKFLIFLDINMPVMNGWEFLDQVSANGLHEKLIVYMVTSSSDISDKEKATGYSILKKYLEKPVSKQDYLELKASPELKPLFE